MLNGGQLGSERMQYGNSCCTGASTFGASSIGSIILDYSVVVSTSHGSGSSPIVRLILSNNSSFGNCRISSNLDESSAID